MPGDTIWYAFLRSDGSFQGSGVTEFNDDTLGSTETPAPRYDDESELPYWRDGEWVVEPL